MSAVSIFHSADWHLGRVLHGKSLLEDQTHILAQIIGLLEQKRPSAMVIAGDLFDRSVPSAEAVRLADWFFQECAGHLGIPTIVIAGNHDSPDRLEFAAGLLGRQGLHIRGSFDPELKPILIGPPENPIEIYPIPYAEPIRIHLALDQAELPGRPEDCNSHQAAWDRIIEVLRQRWARLGPRRRVLVAHLFAAGGQASDSERPLSVGGADLVQANTFVPFDLTLLGHLHRRQTQAGSVHYSGSPLCYGLGELGQDKSILEFKIDSQTDTPISCAELPLIPLRPVSLLRDQLSVLLSGGSQDYVYAQLTDPQPVQDAFLRLQARYPNLLHVERDPGLRQGGTASPLDERRKALSEGPLRLIQAFLRNMAGSEIPERWMEIVAETLAEQASAERDGQS